MVIRNSIISFRERLPYHINMYVLATVKHTDLTKGIEITNGKLINHISVNKTFKSKCIIYQFQHRFLVLQH